MKKGLMIAGIVILTVILIKHITNAILLKTISQFVKFFEKQNLDPDLDNIRDEILGDIHQTLYLFSLN